MSQQELLKRVVGVLDQANIAYMITGSVASSLQGEPRSTHDIDLVVRIPKVKATRLKEAFSAPDFYLDETSVLKAIEEKDMFNLIEAHSGDKVDFWILTDDPFDQSRFSRKYVEEFQGVRMCVSSPEDTILMKLRWASLSGGSEKQFTDALRIYEVQNEHLDTVYLKQWARRLKVETLWERIKKEAQFP